MQPMNFLLNAADILRHSQASSLGVEIEVVHSTGSTNADLRANLAHLSGPRLLVAENQTAGRGRAGRSWQAVSGSSLCFSLAWQFQGALSSLAGLSLVVGVSLAQTLTHEGWPVQLKWPNDLLKDGLKLGGVLIESVPVRSQSHAVWAIIGIGLNTQRSENLCASVGHEIAALSMRPIAQPIDRNRLCAQLVDGLTQALQEFQQHGLKNFIAPWQQYHAYANQVVSITEQGRLLHEGIASGIDADGRLLLQSLTAPTQFTAIAVGDVSLRPA
jgi:BirA family biotin operon repressor/biotin-[acetyl-CoA-carboxylase] ligase